MHIESNDKASKTECMYFPAFEKKYQESNTENIDVGDGCVSLKAKRMIYLAIPINLVLWGAESWALTDKS
eukprot:scaffold159167_cov25-Attheya_sp.AAC.1